MNGSWIIFGALVAAVTYAVASSRCKNTDPDMEDGYVSAESIREGVRNGWYNAVLVRRNNEPFVRITGNNVNGEQVDELFHITQDDFDALHEDGFLIEL